MTKDFINKVYEELAEIEKSLVLNERNQRDILSSSTIFDSFFFFFCATAAIHFRIFPFDFICSFSSFMQTLTEFKVLSTFAQDVRKQFAEITMAGIFKYE